MIQVVFLHPAVFKSPEKVSFAFCIGRYIAMAQGHTAASPAHVREGIKSMEEGDYILVYVQ